MVQDTVTKKSAGEALVRQNRCIVALGSNATLKESRPADLLQEALSRLESKGFVIRARSRFFRTPAFPAGSGPEFVNAVAVLETGFDAFQTLAHLHAIEAELGRVRVHRWGARTLDLDLIAVGAQVLPDTQTHTYWREMLLDQQKTETPDTLILPHPRLAERAFVLVPMLEVAPDWCHPVTGASVRQMSDALPDALRSEVVAL